MLYPNLPNTLSLMHVLLHLLQYFSLFSFILFACYMRSVSHKQCETPGIMRANNEEVENAE